MFGCQFSPLQQNKKLFTLPGKRRSYNLQVDQKSIVGTTIAPEPESFWASRIRNQNFLELTRILSSARQKILRKTLISFVFVTS
jgi:hypothetical protein